MRTLKGVPYFLPQGSWPCFPPLFGGGVLFCFVVFREIYDKFTG